MGGIHYMNKQITVIAPTRPLFGNGDLNIASKFKRVGAYCRVSTDSESQLNSNDNQIEAWTKRILENPSYQLVKVYDDGGASGTSTKGRAGFAEMIEDCKQGKLDLILCKSISRFARNTVTTIQTVRDLKELGVEVYFDNEGISSFDGKSELIFSILSSIAQEESRHISENVKWTFRKMMSEGFVFLNTKRFLGYDRDPVTKNLVINEEEAEIVRLIYNLYDSGIGSCEIARILQERGYKTSTGMDKWCDTTITGILRNEKYKGDVLLQKTFTVDYLTHKTKRNKGQEQQYYVANNHEPIVSIEQWDRVQLRLEENKRRFNGKCKDFSKFNTRHPLSGQIICIHCGQAFKRRHWLKGYKVPRIMYQCSGYVVAHPGKRCAAKPLNEQIVLEATADVINTLFLNDKSKSFNKLYEVIEKNLSSDSLENSIKEKEVERDALSKKVDFLLEERMNATSLEIKSKLDEKYLILANQYKLIAQELSFLEDKKKANDNAASRLARIKELLGNNKISRDMITKDIMDVFIYKIIAIDRNNIVFVIDSTHTMTIDKLIEKRKEVAAKQGIYNHIIGLRDPKRLMKLSYKVVLV